MLFGSELDGQLLRLSDAAAAAHRDDYR